MSTRPTCHAAGPSEVKRTARRLIPNPINSCANGSGIPNLRQMPWSRMHKDSWELVLHATHQNHPFRPVFMRGEAYAFLKNALEVLLSRTSLDLGSRVSQHTSKQPY